MSDRGIKAIKHPMAQQILTEWQHFRKGHPVATKADEPLLLLVDEIFLELAVIKLGIIEHQPMDPGALEAGPSEVLHSLCKVVEKLYKK